MSHAARAGSSIGIFAYIMRSTSAPAETAMTTAKNLM
jgi:hypothetical protein